MVHKECGSPLKQQYICPKDGRTVEREDIAKGYEYVKDKFVLFTPEEIKAVEEEATRAIAIMEFVPMVAVDPVYFDKPYYLGPEKNSERAYRLLSEAMKQTGVAGLAQYAARGKQYLVMLRPMEGGLAMQQLRYAEEVRPFAEIGAPQTEVKPEELQLALQLMQQTMKQEFHPERYQDTVKKRMQEIIQQKVEGQEITFAPGEAPKAQIIDLMEALKASLGSEAEETAKPARAAAGDRKPARPSPRSAPRAAESGGRKRATR